MSNAPTLLKSGTFTRKKYNRILASGIGGWIVSLIDGCADTVLAGAFLDEAAVSAISLVAPITSVVSFLCYLISVGTAVLFSRECGAFRKEKGYEIVGQGVLCSIGVSIILVVSLLLVREPLLAFYGASEEITAMARQYYMCEIIFAAVYPLYYIIYQLVIIDGDDVISFLACLVGALANLVASFFLVGPYGVSGLAYGTIIGTGAGILVYCIHFLKKSNSVKVKLHFSFRDFGDVVKISSSTSMTLLYVALIDIIMNRFVIARFGDTFIPAYAVVNLILNLGAIFCGLHDASAGFVSVAYGERNPAGLNQTMKIVHRSILVHSAVMIVILEAIATFVPDIYGIVDPAARAASIFATRVIAIASPATAIYYVLCSYYPAVGHVWYGHIISAVYMLVAPLALAIPLGLAFGFEGMSIGFMLTSVVAVLATAVIVRIKHGKGAFPLILDKTDEESVSYEFVLTTDNITGVCEKIKDDLKARNVPDKVSNEVQLMFEEGYMTIMERNEGRKVSTECDILISDKSIRMITRDNGEVFDITDVNAKIKDFRTYMLAMLMERNPERTNTTTISFNRNSYLWSFDF